MLPTAPAAIREESITRSCDPGRAGERSVLLASAFYTLSREGTGTDSPALSQGVPMCA